MVTEVYVVMTGEQVWHACIRDNRVRLTLFQGRQGSYPRKVTCDWLLFTESTFHAVWRDGRESSYRTGRYGTIVAFFLRELDARECFKTGWKTQPWNSRWAKETSEALEAMKDNNHFHICGNLKSPTRGIF